MTGRTLFTQTLVTALVVLAVAPVTDGNRSAAWEASSLVSLTFTGTKSEKFMNYDFGSRSAANGAERPLGDPERTEAQSSVDWPMTLLFYNSANINKVKNKLLRYFPYSTEAGVNFATRQWARLNDGHGWRTDTDRGKKDSLCPELHGEGSSASHYRVYADADDHMKSYRINLGFYVIATTHHDVNECLPFAPDSVKNSGYSDDAEEDVAKAAEKVWGRSNVQRHYAFWQNQEESRRIESHVWQSDGYATRIRIPGLSPVK
jgi:hypothetical protein